MSALLVGVVGKWTWSLNDILVFSSLVAFVFIVLACSLMWTTRPVVKKESPEQRAERRRSSWAPLQPENTVGSVKSKGSASSKIKEKKKLGKKERLKDLERGTSELSNSFEGESLLGEQLGLDGPTVMAPISQGDSVLAQTLLSVLGQGMVLIVYNEKGAKQATVTLVGGSELHWRSVKLFAKKGKQLNLREVLFVSSGKQTKKFKLKTSEIAVEDCCFSLTTSTDTIDFEATSKVERDALVQGFTILLTRFEDPRTA